MGQPRRPRPPEWRRRRSRLPAAALGLGALQICFRLPIQLWGATKSRGEPSIVAVSAAGANQGFLGGQCTICWRHLHMVALEDAPAGAPLLKREVALAECSDKRSLCFNRRRTAIEIEQATTESRGASLMPIAWLAAFLPSLQGLVARNPRPSCLGAQSVASLRGAHHV